MNRERTALLLRSLIDLAEDLADEAEMGPDIVEDEVVVEGVESLHSTMDEIRRLVNE